MEKYRKTEILQIVEEEGVEFIRRSLQICSEP